MVGKNFGRFLGLAVAASVLLAGAGMASAQDVFNMPSGQTSLVMVPVGNPGNAKDTRVMDDGTTGYGQVNYAYRIGEYDVTAGQYTAFLNAVAKTDTYGLYNTTQARTDYGSGITRTGSSGSYVYSVDPASVNRPVNYVSFWDSCRFANWLQNGQPTGAQNASTTEDGAYTLTSTGMANNTITRNTGTTWAVTSEDEWYKAAYYNPAAGNYYLFPTSSNTAPGNNLADPLGNNANCYTGTGPYPIDNGRYTTVVGQFQNSASPYGTFDQGGDVWQWDDRSIYGSYGGLRGGSFDNGVYNLQSSVRSYDPHPSYAGGDVGFRVSQVPEPASLGVLSIGVIGMLIRRRGAAN
ncbi:MAG TPA: SUMF1/EgtB/PvdO family nonheme iron enzyme [Phycisphaerae bacterium]|nr:SUMF1/EgtB/PvdO family nonheme iron enzyme [Phycisphaerae bacterium]